MALKLIKVTPKKALNKAFLKVRPLRSEMDLFKSNLITLLDKVKNDESEEHQKNNIRDFLLNTYYKGNNEINTKGTQDLVIHTDKTIQSKVGVIIEAKRPSNKSEWITIEKINVKAVQELVLYYMRERVDEKNIDIKYLIATNINEWYIFDASYFDKVFYGNRNFVKQYEEWRDGKKVTRDTALFYNEIARPFIESLEDELPVTYFDIRDYDKELRNADKSDDKKLIALQKLLSSYHLLRVPFANDSNELNSRFYKELLHIIGLEEVKDGGKQVIKRKTKDASEGSMIENTINILKTEDILLRLKNKQIFGETKDEQLYNIALELNLTWINRVLFLKLLEGQLLSYHKNDKRYNFLNKDVVFDYDEIYKLFHQVLAKTKQDRSGANIQKYQWVPYLNSSLFEISELENLTIKINSLDDHALLDVMNGSILSIHKNKSINPLQYLYEFLDAYDFASEGVEEVQEDNRTLINASILGKIFEKINGYKDGSIYTPGFITMYMCRQATRRAVVQKFKDAYGWNINEFGDIRNYIADRKSKADLLEFNALINSLRLCDPAVGSGHFLVSGLNELVLIKYELGILCDGEGQRITDYDLTIENDELIVTYSNGDIFEYQIINGKPKSKEDQRLQKSLFHEKQTIIENCLFGVDINPNSVKICRLRLWIELLKNAYYSEESGYTELETLPNIDINIKCGNSLISRFAIDADLSTALKSIKYDIKAYRALVQDYKNCKDREAKRGIEEIINAIKNDFRSEIGKKDKDVLKLNALSGELFNLVNQQAMFETEKDQNAKKEKIHKLETEINALSAKIEEIKNNAIYRDAFEWRFEFPEVLDDNGNFVGFDVVVGNPPYIRQEEVKEMSINFETNYKTYSGKSDIYVFFYEKGINILNNNGTLNFITSGKYFEASYGKPLVKFIINECEINSIINFNDLPVFEGVTAYPLIFSANKIKKDDFSFPYYNLTELPKRSLQEKLESTQPLITTKSIFIQNDFKFVDDAIASIIKNTKLNSISLQEFCGLPIVGVKTGYNEGFMSDISESKFIKPYIFGKDIKKYQPVNSNNKIIFPYNNDFSIASLVNEPKILLALSNQKDKLSNRAIIKDGLISGTKCWYEYQQVNKTVNYNEEYIVYPNVSFGNNFSLSTGAVIDMTAFLIKSNSRYLLAILNSKLIAFLMKIWSISRRGGYLEYKVQYIEKIPIKNISETKQKPFIVLVNKILELKQQNQDTTDLEAEIDRLVYELYGLTEDEIKIIEGK